MSTFTTQFCPSFDIYREDTAWAGGDEPDQVHLWASKLIESKLISTVREHAHRFRVRSQPLPTSPSPVLDLPVPVDAQHPRKQGVSTLLYLLTLFINT